MNLRRPDRPNSYIPIPARPSTRYNRTADMQACVQRHAGLRIVVWDSGRWHAVHQPWRTVEAAVYAESAGRSLKLEIACADPRLMLPGGENPLAFLDGVWERIALPHGGSNA
jgi:hypothetical protein